MTRTAAAVAAAEFIGGLAGTPSLVENRVAAGVHLDLIVPLAGGGIAHLVRIEGGSWLGPFRFARDLQEPIDATAMTQSNFGGNLEAVVRLRYALKFFWHAGGRWYGPINIPSPAVWGAPCLIQSTFGTRGNFEIVVPFCGGGIGYISRDNDDPCRPWRSASFGRDASEFPTDHSASAVTLTQSADGLEVIARYGVDLDVYWTASPLTGWHSAVRRCYGGETGQPGPTGNMTVVRSRIGPLPVLELLTPWSSGGVAHFYRETGDPGGEWIGPTLLLTDIGMADDIVAVESTKQPGTLLLVMRTGDQLWFTTRTRDLMWSVPVPLLAFGHTRGPGSEEARRP